MWEAIEGVSRCCSFPNAELPMEARDGPTWTPWANCSRERIEGRISPSCAMADRSIPFCKQRSRGAAPNWTAESLADSVMAEPSVQYPANQEADETCGREERTSRCCSED